MKVLSAVMLVLWVMAFFRTLLNLALVPRLRAGAPADGPLVSVLIPARNEALSIERTVLAFLAQRYSAMEIIVVDDRSTDGTSEILDRLAAAHSSLIVIRGTETPAGWLGKTWALHQAFLQARGELLLFVDADLVYGPDAVAAAVAQLQASRAGLLTVLPRLELHGFWENVLLPVLPLSFYTFFPTWFSNRTRGRFLALGAGTGNLVWRAAYEAAGGHAAMKASVVDDVGLARLVRSAGLTTRAANGESLIALRMYRGGREIVDGFTKNFFSIFGRSYTLAVSITVASLVLHLGPYVLGAMGDPIAMATVGVITLTRIWLFRALGYPMGYAILAHPLMALAFYGWIGPRSIWFTGVRGRLEWRGRSYDAAGVE
jgi:chlorobactene glucosyltransferase